MKHKLIRIVSGLLMASVLVAACTPAATVAPTAVPATVAPTAAPAASDTPAAAAATATTAPAASSFKGTVCEVTDTGGVDDKAFNALGWSGAHQAATDVGTTASYLESKQQTDYEKNI